MRQVFISGASSDIGIQACRRYLENGWRVVAQYNLGQDSFWDLASAEKHLTPIKMDFTHAAELEATLNAHAEIIASSDALINGAAVLRTSRFDEITAGSVLDAISINLLPALLLTRRMAPELTKKNWGRIVNLSSVGVKFGGGSSSFCYALSKHALEFLPADHKNWAAHDVFINTLRIGVTDTRIHRQDPKKNMESRVDLIPAGRMATPEEMSEIIFWYGSENNKFITGQTITAAGGE